MEQRLGAVLEEAGASPSVPAGLREIRPGVWVFWFAVNWGVIALAYALIAWGGSWWLVPPAVLVIGTRQHALAILGHDATHRLAFRRRWLNDVMGEAIGWPLLIVQERGYRPWHFGHHRHLGTETDPELDYRGGRPYQGRVTWWRVARCFVCDLVGLGLPDLLYFMWIVLPRTAPVRYLGPVLLWVTAGALLYAAGALWVMGVWALALVTAFWAVFRVRAFTEHVSVPADRKKSSHRFRAGPIARFLFFPHNTWYHYEHHRWPQIPFYHLPGLRPLDRTTPVNTLRGLFPVV